MRLFFSLRFAFLAAAILSAINLVALTAAHHVAESDAEDQSISITVPPLIPPECAAMHLRTTIVSSGVIYGSPVAALIIGSSRDEVLLGGDGNDILDGGDHTDVCSGDSGANAYTSCETFMDG